MFRYVIIKLLKIKFKEKNFNLLFVKENGMRLI